MSPQYLVPCSCGQKTPVDLAQAGNRIRCACGAEVEVPTLLGLKRLEQTGTTVERAPGPTWGTRQRMILIGGVLGIVGVAIAVLAFLTRPRIMDVASYPPVAALQLWESLKLGVDAPPSVVERAMFLSLQQHHRWTVAGLIMSVLGVLVMAASLPLGRRSAPLTALVFGGGLAGLLLA